MIYHITYDRATREFRIFVNGRFVRHARNYRDGDNWAQAYVASRRRSAGAISRAPSVKRIGTKRKFVPYSKALKRAEALITLNTYDSDALLPH